MAAHPRTFAGRPLPADGHPRVHVVILDCADWRLFRALRAAGQLPFLGWMEDTGWSATLRQDPAFTAAAMRSLTRPVATRPSFVSGLHALGDELAGLSSVGRNPVAALSALLPAGRGLIEHLGAGDRRVVNMLFAHGNIDAGRNGAVTGPRGKVSTLALPVDDLPGGRREPDVALAAARALPHVTQAIDDLARRFDEIEWIVSERTADVLLFRVEPFDLVTHGLYADALAEGDDLGTALFDAYRLADRRLGEIYPKLDADDVLVVMSDHGILTPVEHDPAALLLVIGGGVPAGRAPGEPALSGVAAVIAALAGDTAPFPDTGVARWATAPR